MSLDWDRRVKMEQKRLRSLTDHELMALNLSLLPFTKTELDNRTREANITFEAVYHEVRRRTLAAGWFWRRWRNPGVYEKWLTHTSNTENRLSQVLGEWVRAHDRGQGYAGAGHPGPRQVDALQEAERQRDAAARGKAIRDRPRLADPMDGQDNDECSP